MKTASAKEDKADGTKHRVRCVLNNVYGKQLISYLSALKIPTYDSEDDRLTIEELPDSLPATY